MNATLQNSTYLLSKPDVNLVNQTLCEWYLPTVRQTPLGLGNIGIALWVLGFVITFILMLLFAKQGYFIYKTAHKVYRLHLYFITSVYVIIAMLTSVGSGIPRAHAICSGIKDVYMCIGIGHFMDLTIVMYGSEKVMAYYCRDKVVNLRSILVCKCFICIPRCKVKKRSITILKWLIWQMKWTQAVYYFLRLIINKSTENTLGVSDPYGVQLWYLLSLNLLSFITGVAALLLVRSLVVDDLQERYNYNIKAKIVRFTILTTKLQRLIFDILEASDVFPCFPPYVSQKFYKNVLKDFIYLIEVLILGLMTYFVYNKPGEFTHPNSKEVPQPIVNPEEVEEEVEVDESERNGNFDSKLIVALDQKLESMKESTC
ncbi:UNVERIFIED_CONTAM: hypothetical protein RMT77_010477 [Armadillidium vulgare]